MYAAIARIIFFSNSSVVIGPRDDGRACARLDGLTGRVIRRSVVIAHVFDLEANTGRLSDIVRRVADVLGACGEMLRAGEVIIAGSVVPPLFLEPDENTMIFALDPVGSAISRFSST